MPTYLGNILIPQVRLGSVGIGEGVQFIAPNYVTQTATLILDAGDSTSYTSGSIYWNNIANVSYATGSNLENGLQNTYTTNKGGYFTFPYTSSYLVNMGGVYSTNVSFAGNFTFNIWFTIDNFRGGADDFVGLLVKDDFNDNPGFGILVNRDTNAANRGEVRFYANDNSIGFPTKATLTSGAWNNLQITRSGSVITGYWNGTSLGTGSNGSSLDNANNMTFGRATQANLYRFEGSVSFIATYSSSLSSGQVAQNYNALLPRYVS
jgi:hypothetical protein